MSRCLRLAPHDGADDLQMQHSAVREGRQEVAHGAIERVCRVRNLDGDC